MEPERPKFRQSLRLKIPLSFIAGALLIWLIANVTTSLIDYIRIGSLIAKPELYRPVRDLLPKLTANKDNPAAQEMVLGEMTERLRDKHREEAGFLYYTLERHDFSGLEFVRLTLVDERGNPLSSVSGRLTGGPVSISPENLTDRSRAVVSEVFRSTVETDGGIAEGVAVRAWPGNEGSEHPTVLLMTAQIPFSTSDFLLKVLLDFVYDIKDVWIFLALFGAIFGILQANQVMRELDEIARAVESWSNGDFTDKADVPHSDELGFLARRLNRMSLEIGEIFEMRQTLAAADERTRIARDLHDSVKQQVFSLSLQIGAAQTLFHRDQAKSFARIEEAQKLTAQVQHELVELISELRLTNEKRIGFEERIRGFLTDWSRQNGVSFELEWAGSALPGPAVEHALFRIFQEVCANVARHSRATKLMVEVESSSPTRISLTVRDNGHGFDQSARSRGFGLQNMSERAAALEGGFFRIESTRGSGTTVCFGVQST